MRRFIVVTALTLSLLSGCVAVSGRTSCPPPVEGLDSAADITAGDFAEWEQRTLQYAAGLVGMEESAAEKCVLDQGLVWRVVGRDGEFFPVTADYSPSRINATISAGIVSEVSAG